MFHFFAFISGSYFAALFARGFYFLIIHPLVLFLMPEWEYHVISKRLADICAVLSGLFFFYIFFSAYWYLASLFRISLSSSIFSAQASSDKFCVQMPR